MYYISANGSKERVGAVYRRISDEYLDPMNFNPEWVDIHASTVLEATFAHSLNSIGTPVLVVEMGVGMRLTRTYGDQLVHGILNLMRELGIWTGDFLFRRYAMARESLPVSL